MLKTETLMAIFIGENGSMGLFNGEKYYVRIYESQGFYFVEWVDVGIIKITRKKCSYSSIEKILENWIFPEVERKMLKDIGYLANFINYA